jgi:SAM-dependent methyltransferase
MRRLLCAAAALLAAANFPCGGFAADRGERRPDAAQMHEAEVLYLPTPQHVVDEMLRLAGLAPGDVLYDLGSGDGRIVITAARRYGVRAVGIELDARRVEQARRSAEALGVSHLVEFRQQDLFEADFGEATVVTLFLFKEMNLRLKPRLLRGLRPGARVVSHRFDMGDWRPEREIVARGHPLYLWTIP